MIPEMSGNAWQTTNQGKEFKEALANGSGQDIRMSDSKGQEMYYYALKMDDSSVLRVSRGMDTVWNTAFMILPYMIAIGVMMACVHGL